MEFDDAQLAMIDRRVRKVLREVRRSEQHTGHVDQLEPLRVTLASGDPAYITSRAAGLQLASGDPVALVKTASGYHVAGRRLSDDDVGAVETHTHEIAEVPTDVELIGTAAGDGVSGTLQFADIPQDYLHLQLVGHIAHTGGTVTSLCRLRWNAIATASYLGLRHFRDASGANSVAGWPAGSEQTGLPAFLGNLTGTCTIDLARYSEASTTHSAHFFLGARHGTGGGSIYQQDVWGYLPSNTDAVTDVRLVMDSGDGFAFTTGSRLSLYGLRG